MINGTFGKWFILDFIAQKKGDSPHQLVQGRSQDCQREVEASNFLESEEW